MVCRLWKAGNYLFYFQLIILVVNAVNGGSPVVYPRTCYEVQVSGGLEGIHNLDPDLDGLDPVTVFCNMSSTPVSAVLHHNLEEWTDVGDEYEEAFSFNGELLYTNGVTMEDARRLIMTSNRCTYYLEVLCEHIRFKDIRWVSYYGNVGSWERLGGTYCLRDDGQVICECGINTGKARPDKGDAGNWPLFPLVSVRFGDTGLAFERIDFRIGPLICEQGPVLERRIEQRQEKRQTNDVVRFARIHSKAHCAMVCSFGSQTCMGFNFQFGPPVVCELSPMPWDAPTASLVNDANWDHYSIIP